MMADDRICLPSSVLRHRVTRQKGCAGGGGIFGKPEEAATVLRLVRSLSSSIQKGGDPAAGSPTATLLRLHPSR